MQLGVRKLGTMELTCLHYHLVVLLLLCICLTPSWSLSMPTRESVGRHMILPASSSTTTRKSACLSKTELPESSGRRSWMQQCACSLLLLGTPSSSHAIMTDETDKFADNWWSSETRNSNPTATTTTTTTTTPATNLPRQVSDEITILVPKDQLAQGGGLGIELSETEFRTNRRVYVKSITPGSLAEKLGIQQDWIVVAIDGTSAERTDAAGVAILVSRAMKKSSLDSTAAIELRFRDPAIFKSKLQTLDQATGEVTTQIAPAGDTTQRNPDGSVRLGQGVTEQEDQRLTVTQLIPPKFCSRRAEIGDLLEISYVGIVPQTGMIFDGSAVMINGQAIPGRANDVSLFFVLGKQPFGQFPPGFDVGLADMCVGERRRLLVPPVLAYGSTGLPRRGIPPNATLQYDVTLVSLNGLATPQ